MIHQSSFTRQARPARGQSLIEFALILPLLLMFAFFVIDFGRAVYYYSVINNAAREGARYAAVVQQSDPTVTDLAAIIAAARQHTYGLPAGSVNVTAQKDVPSETIQVRVSYCFTPVTPLVQSFLGSCLTLRSQSSMFQER